MIFRAAMLEKVLSGEKTETRRPLTTRYKPGGGPGGSYAVCPGRGQHAVARMRVRSVRNEPLGMIDTAGARREGFDSIYSFLAYWRELYGAVHLGELVTVIRFELVELTIGTSKR